jgi:WD40 repeat protein
MKSSSPPSDVDPSNLMFDPEADLCRFFSRHSTGVESLVFTSDSQWLAVGRSDGQIDIYDVTARQLLMVR